MTEEDFPEIKTGNGIDRDLAATANNRIKRAIIKLGELGDAVKSLERTIVNLDNKNKTLQKRIFWLTVVGVALTATQLIELLDILKRHL